MKKQYFDLTLFLKIVILILGLLSALILFFKAKLFYLLNDGHLLSDIDWNYAIGFFGVLIFIAIVFSFVRDN